MNDYMPIGSIVKLKQADNVLFMITGLYIENENGEIRDYIAVRYPMGAMDNSKYFFFNGSGIKETIHLGYINEDHTAYSDLINVVKNQNNKNKVN